MASSPEGDKMVTDSPEDESAAQSVHETVQDETVQDQVPSDCAPRYAIPLRDLAAVEVPAVVENIDRTVMAFGRLPSLSHVLDPVRSSLPLYLNPESPFCPPIMSHNARSHNVVLKVTVPKRTGRKRKRGTDDPWQGDVEVGDADAAASGPRVCSIARLDEPKVLRRKLADNADKYQVEAVGIIKHTHRFRGLADFYWDMSKSSFAQRYADQVLPGDIQKLKTFKFRSGIDHGPNVDIIPPPLFTHMSLPFNYYYSQNPYVRTAEDGVTINTTAVKQVGHFISAEAPTPTGPRFPPDVTDTKMMEAVAQLEEAFEERPIWTRRSILNHLGGKLRNWNELKKYLNYAAYQFKGGPWRDSVVVYGIDPRTDPKYRIYQTLMFKLSRRGHEGQTWQSVRRSQINVNKEYAPDKSQSHMFDGESYYTDSKVWQVCDITDPLLREMLGSAAVRPECDINSGWYHGGLWAKVKAIMKTKLVAIQFGRDVSRQDFAATLEYSDRSPTRTASASFHLPLPNLHLSNEELRVLRGREPPKKSQGYNVRFRKTDKGAGAAAEQSSPAADPQDIVAEGDDSGSGGEYGEDAMDDEAEYPGHPAYSDDDRVDDEEDDDDGEEDGLAAVGGTVYPELD